MNKKDARLMLELIEQVQNLERRIDNIIRPGVVTEADLANGKVKVAYAQKKDGSDQTTPFIKWTERAGKTGSDEPGIKTWFPPAVGEQVILISPSGEMGGHTWAIPGGFSDVAGAPHNAAGEPVIEVGDTRITLSGERVKCETRHVLFDVSDDVEFSVGGTKITADTGKVSIDADTIELNGSQQISLETASLNIKAASASWDIAGKISSWGSGGMVWNVRSVDWIIE